MKTANNRWNRIAGYLSGELDREQQQQFLEDISQDAALNHDFETMKKTWNNFSTNPSEKYRDTGSAWNSLKHRIECEGMTGEESEPPKTSRFITRSALYRLAATVALVLAVGIPAMLFMFDRESPGDETIYHHAAEGVLTVDLPDGSRVFLNEGSNLDYTPSFNEQREVRLEGEGYFDVMADPENPFRVNAGKVVVTVLGTSFNVKETVETKAVEVFVESGSVEVALEASDERVTLEPGDLGLATENLQVDTQADENYLSWKTRKFKFVDEQVVEILSVLEKSYHVDIIAGGISLEDRRLTTTYNEQSFDAILSTICAALDLNYEKEGKVYTLHSN